LLTRTILILLASLIAILTRAFPRDPAEHATRHFCQQFALAHHLRKALFIRFAIGTTLTFHPAFLTSILPRFPTPIPLPLNRLSLLGARTPRKATRARRTLLVGLPRTRLLAGSHGIVVALPAPQARRVALLLDRDPYPLARVGGPPARLAGSAILVGFALRGAGLQHVVPRAAAPSTARRQRLSDGHPRGGAIVRTPRGPEALWGIIPRVLLAVLVRLASLAAGLEHFRPGGAAPPVLAVGHHFLVALFFYFFVQQHGDFFLRVRFLDEPDVLGGEFGQFVAAVAHAAEARGAGGAIVVVPQEAARAAGGGGVLPIPTADVVDCGIHRGDDAVQPSVAGASVGTLVVFPRGTGVEAFVLGGFPSVAAVVGGGVGHCVGCGERQGEGRGRGGVGWSDGEGGNVRWHVVIGGEDGGRWDCCCWFAWQGLHVTGRGCGRVIVWGGNMAI